MSSQNPYDPQQPAWGQPPGSPAPGYPQQPGYPPLPPQPPSYGQAAYQEPATYQQPAYHPPYDPGYQQFGVPSPSPAKKNKTWLWVTLGIVAVVLLGCGIGGYVLLGDSFNKLNETLVTPAEVHGLTLTNDANLTALAENAKTSLRNQVKNSTGSIAGFYSDPADPTKLVMVVGVSGTVANPKNEMSDAFNELQASGLPASDVHAVPAGDLGGETKCGTGSTAGQSLIVCIWADDSSVGMVVFFNRPTAEAEPLFQAFRTAIIKRD